MTDENALPPSKKRAAGREISRDNPGLDDEDDVSEQETGTFKKASEDVLARRKIVKVRRQPASSAPPAPTFNPFSGIRLVPPVSATTTTTDVSNNELQAKAEIQVEEKAADKEDKETDENKVNEKELAENTDKAVNETSADKEKLNIVDNATCEETPVEKEAEVVLPDKSDEKANNVESDGQAQTDAENTSNGEKKDDADNEKKNDNGTPFSSFQQLSSTKNAFTGFSGSGFPSSPFCFGSIPKEGSPSGSAFSFGSTTDKSPLPSFSFAASNNGSTPLFGSATSSGNKTEKSPFPSMQEVPVETGEENEETVFTADSALFEYSEGGWKERGKGEVKVNVSTSGGKKARLVMRARGNYRLIMNAYLYPDMKLTKMDKKGITFACANSASEGKTGLTTFALKFKEASIVETFSASVAAHKGDESGKGDAPALKTPENSPKAAEE